MSQSDSSLREDSSLDNLPIEKRKRSSRRVFTTGSIFDKLLKKKSGSQSQPKKSASTSSIVMEDPPLTPVSFSGYKSTTKQRLLNTELADEIRNLMPARIQLYSNWELLYSLEQHGISLNTLYHNCNPETQFLNKRKERVEHGFGEETIQTMIGGSGRTSFSSTNKREGYILIIKDSGGNVFGCYVNEYFRPMDHRRYYGNGECFLWKTERVSAQLSTSNFTSNGKPEDNHTHVSDPLANDKSPNKPESQAKQNLTTTRFQAFPYTGLNDYIVYSNQSFLAVGVSGGKFGLYVDSDLNEGVSYPCDTFGNETLSGKEKFKILSLEVWKVC